MPVDFSAWLRPADAPTDIITFGKNIYPGAKNVVQHIGGKQEEILNILQKNFAANLAMSDAKVTLDKPAEYGTKAAYGGLKGNVIQAGKLTGDTYTYVDPTGKQPTTKRSDYPNEKSDLMDNAFVMLHEIYHANAEKTGYYGNKLGSNWKELLADAEKARFPSVGTGIGGGDNLNEFLASATTVQAMQSKGLSLGDKYKNLAPELDKLKEKYSWMQDWLDTYQRPELLAGTKKP